MAANATLLWWTLVVLTALSAARVHQIHRHPRLEEDSNDLSVRVVSWNIGDSDEAQLAAVQDVINRLETAAAGLAVPKADVFVLALQESRIPGSQFDSAISAMGYTPVTGFAADKCTAGADQRCSQLRVYEKTPQSVTAHAFKHKFVEYSVKNEDKSTQIKAVSINDRTYCFVVSHLSVGESERERDLRIQKLLVRLLPVRNHVTSEKCDHVFWAADFKLLAGDWQTDCPHPHFLDPATQAYFSALSIQPSGLVHAPRPASVPPFQKAEWHALSRALKDLGFLFPPSASVLPPTFQSIRSNKCPEASSLTQWPGSANLWVEGGTERGRAGCFKVGAGRGNCEDKLCYSACRPLAWTDVVLCKNLLRGKKISVPPGGYQVLVGTDPSDHFPVIATYQVQTAEEASKTEAGTDKSTTTTTTTTASDATAGGKKRVRVAVHHPPKRA